MKNEMGGAYSTYWGESYTGFWWGNLREEDYLGDPGVDERIILRWIFRKRDVGVWHSVQNLLSSSLLSKNMKIKIYRTIILPVVLYECEIWSLTRRGTYAEGV